MVHSLYAEISSKFWWIVFHLTTNMCMYYYDQILINNGYNQFLFYITYWCSDPIIHNAIQKVLSWF